MRKNLTLKIVSVLMTIISIKGTVFVFTDTEFDYNGLPMALVYVMLGVFVLATVYVLYLGFIKKRKSCNS